MYLFAETVRQVLPHRAAVLYEQVQGREGAGLTFGAAAEILTIIGKGITFCVYQKIKGFLPTIVDGAGNVYMRLLHKITSFRRHSITAGAGGAIPKESTYQER